VDIGSALHSVLHRLCWLNITSSDVSHFRIDSQDRKYKYPTGFITYLSVTVRKPRYGYLSKWRRSSL